MFCPLISVALSGYLESVVDEACLVEHGLESLPGVATVEVGVPSRMCF